MGKETDISDFSTGLEADCNGKVLDHGVGRMFETMTTVFVIVLSFNVADRKVKAEESEIK